MPLITQRSDASHASVVPHSPFEERKSQERVERSDSQQKEGEILRYFSWLRNLPTLALRNVARALRVLSGKEERVMAFVVTGPRPLTARFGVVLNQ